MKTTNEKLADIVRALLNRDLTVSNEEDEAKVRAALKEWEEQRPSLRDSGHVHVLTIKAKDHPHTIDWYFLDKAEAEDAEGMARGNAHKFDTIELRQDFITEAFEFQNWLVEESIIE